jgi:hypothetical protein
MQSRSSVVVDVLDEAGVELDAVVLVTVGGVVAMAPQDGDELRARVEELHRSQMVSHARSRPLVGRAA